MHYSISTRNSCLYTYYPCATNHQTDIMNPANPTKPGQPPNPAFAYQPPIPIWPGQPPNPALPGQPPNPAWPGQPPNPALPGQPPNPAWPGQPPNPAWPGQPPNPALPGQPPNPAWPGQPPNPVWPSPPTNPAWPGTSPNPAWPGQPPNPAWPGQPNQPAPPTWPGQPGHPGAPGWPGPVLQTGPHGIPEPPKPLTVPFEMTLVNGVYNKMLITINGEVNPNPEHLTIDIKKDNDVALHINPRFNHCGKQMIVRNSLIGNRWGPEERECPSFPFVPGKPFEMKILCTDSAFKVAVNKSHLLEYKHRIRELKKIKTLRIYNDLTLKSVNVETLP